MLAVAYGFITYNFTVTILPWWSGLILFGFAEAFVLTLIFFLRHAQRKPGRPR